MCVTSLSNLSINENNIIVKHEYCHLTIRKYRLYYEYKQLITHTHEGTRTMKTKTVVDQAATAQFGFTCYRTANVAPFAIKSEVIEGDTLTAEIRGINSHMRRGYDWALATYGCFYRNGRTLVYTTSVWRDENGEIEHNPNSEMLDDIYQLIDDQIEWMH